MFGLRGRSNQASADPRAVLVLLRSDVLRAGTVSRALLDAAAAGAGERGVVVALVLRVHGSAFGLPNPGLLPTARERAAGQARMTQAIRALRRAGVDADGEILVTRHPARAVARLARRRAAELVLVEPAPAGRVRRLLEGDVHRQLIRRLGASVRVTAG